MVHTERGQTMWNGRDARTNKLTTWGYVGTQILLDELRHHFQGFPNFAKDPKETISALQEGWRVIRNFMSGGGIIDSSGEILSDNIEEASLTTRFQEKLRSNAVLFISKKEDLSETGYNAKVWRPKRGAYICFVAPGANRRLTYGYFERDGIDLGVETEWGGYNQWEVEHLIDALASLVRNEHERVGAEELVYPTTAVRQLFLDIANENGKVKERPFDFGLHNANYESKKF